jgi:NAD(P)-dependent dehydrogenase (short-subunit alcohol dehydrogenase family)
MAHIFITGSAEGLGLQAGERLVAQGHQVTLHARSDKRAADARRALPAVERVIVGDVTTLDGMRRVADQANLGQAFDAVIHNVAIGYQEPQRVETADGLETVFAVNVLAPYVLTALVARPKRLVYLTSGLHRQGRAELGDPQWKKRRWNGTQAYSDSKLYDTTLALAFARLWPDVRSNSVEPGWVATRMGGDGAPDDLPLGSLTQAWLAVSDDRGALTTGKHFYHQAERDPHPAARDHAFQDALLGYCAEVSGVHLPPG